MEPDQVTCPECGATWPENLEACPGCGLTWEEIQDQPALQAPDDDDE